MHGPTPRLAHAALVLTPHAGGVGYAGTLDGYAGMLLILGGIGEPSEGERTARQSVAQGSGAAAAAQIREAFRSELSIAALSHRGRGFLPPGAHVLGDAWLVVLGGPRGVLGGWQQLAWEEETRRPASRYGHSATAMLGGDVFVFGGMMLEEEEEAWAAAARRAARSALPSARARLRGFCVASFRPAAVVGTAAAAERSRRAPTRPGRVAASSPIVRA